MLILDSLNNAEVDKTLLEGVIVLNWEVASADFVKKFEEKYGVKPTKSADKAYAAVQVLAQALAKTKDKSEVPAYLTQTEFKTVAGQIKFTAEHAVESTPVAVQVIRDGQLELFK